MLKSIFVRLVKRFKNKEFQLDENVTSFYLLGILTQKIIEAIRGTLKVQALVYLGSNVSIKARDKLNLGRSVTIGEYTSIDCLGTEGISLGNCTSIGRFSKLKVSGTISDLGVGIEIGDNVGIGEFAHIGGAGKVTIGSDTIVGPFLSVHPENHNIDDINQLIRLQGVNRKGISVGENCWIGAKVTLLDGTKVGSGCVIAAGAVVRGDFPDNVIIGGVPARILKVRNS